MNNIYKNIALLSVLATVSVFAETVEELDENASLNEIIRQKMSDPNNDMPLSFCGDLNLTALFISQDKNEDYDGSSESLQGNIGLIYVGKKNKFGYGVEIGVKTDSGLIKQGAAIMKTAFVFVEADTIGTIRLGYTNTAADLFCICGDKYLVGYGGAGSGNLGIFYNKSAGSIVDTGFSCDDSRAAKILWLSPTLSGFSIGLSFTPDSRDANLFYTRHCLFKPINEKSCFSQMSAYTKNTTTCGIAYELGAPDDFNAKISASAWFGKGKSGSSDTIEVHNVRAFNIGAMLGYKDFKISLGYTDAGKSLLPRKYATTDMPVAFDDSRNYALSDTAVGLKPGADAGKSFSVGVAYTYEKLTVSAGYFKSEVKFSDNEKSSADIITLAAEYTFDKTVGMYIEYDHISSNTCDRARIYGKACNLSSTGENKANILIMGTKINI
ncbi:MAG: porin [Holosporaceae bacterium]|jgi:predicted porin|nr:porin [Holosporaceae bacterium]